MKYKELFCVSEDPEGRLCNHRMHYMGERYPQPLHYRQNSVHTFQCTYCGALQAIDDDKVDRIALRA